jgi:hypothetical protein
MNWGKYLNNNRTELRLIHLVGALYFFNVFIYTVDDFKRDFPYYLRLMGICFHGLVGLILIDSQRRVKLWGLRRLIEKLLPFGLISTYVLSYYIATQKELDTRGLPLFLVTSVPIIMYILFVGYNIKQLSFLQDRRWIYNNGFLGLFLIVYVWTKYWS